MTLLEKQPLLYFSSDTYSLDKYVDQLIDMEKTLLATQPEDMQYSILPHTYSALFNLLVIENTAGEYFGQQDETRKIFDKDDSVKEAYREVWEKIGSMERDLQTARIMEEIVAEMKASGWKESKSYNRLNEEHISNALSYAKDNSLDSFTIDEIIGFGTMTTLTQDPEYQATVAALYHSFSDNRDYNLVTLQDANPLLIIGVYYYANEVEDPETMWQLLNYEYNPISFEAYVENWTKEEAILEQVESEYL